MSNGNSGKPKVFKYVCKAESNYPVYHGEWGIELEDETEFAFYQNLASDLIAGVFAKMGQEFSKFRLDGDIERLSKSLNKINTVLSGTILDADDS